MTRNDYLLLLMFFVAGGIGAVCMLAGVVFMAGWPAFLLRKRTPREEIERREMNYGRSEKR